MWAHGKHGLPAARDSGVCGNSPRQRSAERAGKEARAAPSGLGERRASDWWGMPLLTGRVWGSHWEFGFGTEAQL